MKRGKNNKAHLGANLLRQVREAEDIMITRLGEPVRASGKTLFVADNLYVLNVAKKYVYKTRVKKLDPDLIHAFGSVITFMISGYYHGQNVYHEEPTVENALIPEEHKGKLNEQTNTTENV